MDPQELTRLIREKQSNLDGKRMVKGMTVFGTGGGTPGSFHK